MIIEVKKLYKAFGGLVAVNNVDLEVEKGIIHAIIGPNGAGKTTFFNALTGLIPADSGEIHFQGERIEELATHKISRLGIGRTFQNIRLFPYLSALDNVRVGAHNIARHSIFSAIGRTPLFRKEEKEITEIAMELLEKVGLAEKKETYARNLPYGEQRKLEIARAMAGRPSLLLLDEPADLTFVCERQHDLHGSGPQSKSRGPGHADRGPLLGDLAIVQQVTKHDAVHLV